MLMRIGLLILIAVLAGAGSPSSPSETPVSAVAPADANSFNDAVLNEMEEELTQKRAPVADPLEPVNRFMFGVNDVAYFWVLKPIFRGYTTVVPQPVRTGIYNFFHNLATPARLVNSILQGKNSAADTELSRFAINTTIGVLGIGDPARARWKLQPAEEDLGQTLAVYGLGDGFYLFWPLFGPSTLRDSVGMLGDEFLNPIRYVPPEEVSLGASGVSTVNSGSFHLGEYETLKSASVDPYIALREAYIQYRQKQIRGEEAPKRDAARLGGAPAGQAEPVATRTQDQPTEPNGVKR
jgi:phospholipid-binding lipoprotein MlaA